MTDDYTVEIWKDDARYKKGIRLVTKYDVKDWDKDELRVFTEDKYKHPYSVRIYKTWVTRKNYLSGEEFQERYDVPYYCSASSETFWSS